MAPIAYLTACEAGVDILDTTISPFAWGTSQPPTETIVGALKGTPFDTGLDLEKLTAVADYFSKVREKYKSLLDPIAERVDPKIMVHQIPGGMLSNLISQLKEQNAMDKYEEVLKETALVRKDLGYPPLVTPTSQIVGTQAVFNVVTGERYKVIPKEVKDYFKGLYGQPPGPLDEEVKRKAIGNDTPIKGRPADGLEAEWTKCQEMTKKYTDKEEDILSYALFPQVAQEFFERRRKGVPATPAISADQATPTAEVTEPLSTIQIGADPANPERLTMAVDDQKYDVVISKVKKRTDTTVLTMEFSGKRYEVELLNETAEVIPIKKPCPDITSGHVEKPATPTAGLPKAPIASKKPLQAETPAAKSHESLPPSPAASNKLCDVLVPMPGKVVSLKVNKGDKVKKGEVLFILEAMKMQNEVNAPVGGEVDEVNIAPGDNVDNNTVVITINPTA
jgi:pyruvate carboxylase